MGSIEYQLDGTDTLLDSLNIILNQYNTIKSIMSLIEIDTKKEIFQDP